MQANATSFDTIIIGGGVIGSSIAYHVAKQDGRVLVVERTEVAIEPAASWASAGGVRRQGRHPAESRLAIEAIERWPRLEQELEANVNYRQGGNLLLAESDEEAERLSTFVRRQQEHGFTDVVLLNRAEVLALVPGLNEQVVAGSYSPPDGQADPMLTARAFAAAAARHGATYWTHTACLSLLTQGKRVIGVQTEQGTVQAEKIVLAAGAWSAELAASIGLQLPVKTMALQMIRSTPTTPGLVQPVLSALSRALSLKQLNSGAFLIGGGWLGDLTTDKRGYTLRQGNIEGSWATASGLLPAVSQQRIERAWCGLEAQSFDEIPFLGPHPERVGLILALGFSGHGFAIAPAVGRALADQLAGLNTPELNGLQSERMADFDQVKVTAFLQNNTTNRHLIDA